MPIWPFRSKQPKLQDEALADLAEMFLSNPDDPTPGGESLERARFDYAIESLRAVDDHLEAMRARGGLEGEAMMKFVLRCGAYVGEVIRRHSPTGTAWHWVTYADAVRLDARLGSIGQSLDRGGALGWPGGLLLPARQGRQVSRERRRGQRVGLRPGDHRPGARRGLGMDD